ncbi:hypothetical protein TSUD_134100 [Trifolium subterraneum]|uniref:Glutaredoxin-like protein n=1 Tax=Trifolium subterraneum TaxID=3900 RepID=A0A2Z6P4N5_TRISU|nr:hypothetical protein TSUD_134100 [Trifolium subterraneum]
MAVARAVTVLAVARPSTVFTGGAQTQRFLKFKTQCYSSTPSSRKLILYSKPGCCLCDGLKEKLQSAFLLSGPHSLSDVDLNIRDITMNPEWEKAYQYEIPVLAKEILPRLSPRLGVELLQKKIAAALGEQKGFSAQDS